MVVLSFLSATVAAWFYYKATQENSDHYRKLARRIFYVQAASVIGIFIVLFAIIFFHKFEYFYAWRHSSKALPVYYMISCFWEGQEGSFLLWMFWNALLGVVLTRTAGVFESPVMAIVSLAQIALGTMLLGLKLGDIHIGSNPFELLRDIKPEMLAGIPNAAGKAMYLKMVQDGNGLNPLLQNYWMVIHPPTLFLGFATSLVPFAFSIAGLWTKRDREWLAPALIWSLVGVGVLGGGIIMGGFWAYESLTFGGYWAWDPVENASLMPWLIMASAAHMVLISRNTGRHLFTSHILIQLSFWLVLYATFLTRSGILGETSVHSFTDLGLSGQLLLFLFGFMLVSLLSAIADVSMRRWVSTGILSFIFVQIVLSYTLPETQIKNIAAALKWMNIIAFFGLLAWYFVVLYKRTKIQGEDEKWTSRELWMFIGAMFLILSLVQVFSATSIPVFNKLFGLDTAVPKAPAYNASQVWLAMPVMLLMALGQWFRYRETPSAQLRKELMLNISISLLVFCLLMVGFGIYEFKYMLFLFCGTWLVVGNVLYFGKQKKQVWLAYGASIAHVGFGILLIGVLVSSVNQKMVTGNAEGLKMANEIDENGKVNAQGVQFNRENRILYLGQPEVLNGYEAMYTGNYRGANFDSINTYFPVLFVKRNADGSIADSFTLKPKAQKNPNMGLISEPSTRHYLHKDVFTHINHESGMDKIEPFAGFKTDTVKTGEWFLTATGKKKLRVDSITRHNFQSYLILRLVVTVSSLNDSATLHPMYVVDTASGATELVSDQNDNLGIMLTLNKVQIEGGNNPGLVLTTGERAPRKPYIVLKTIEFPWINLVWSGTIIMVLGFAVAVMNRLRLQRIAAA